MKYLLIASLVFFSLSASETKIMDGELLSDISVLASETGEPVVQEISIKMENGCTVSGEARTLWSPYVEDAFLPVSLKEEVCADGLVHNAEDKYFVFDSSGKKGFSGEMRLMEGSSDYWVEIEKGYGVRIVGIELGERDIFEQEEVGEEDRAIWEYLGETDSDTMVPCYLGGGAN